MRLLASTVALCALLLAAPINASGAEDPGSTASPAAEAPAAGSKAAREAESKAAWEEAAKAATKGPADIPFMAQATLKLPPGFVYVPVGPSDRLLRSWGNQAGGPGFIGTIFPTADGENWFITAHYRDAGYVKDEEAKNWDVDALLNSAKEGVDASNVDREARGFPKLKVDGWIEKPAYDASQHRLVYAIGLSDLNAPAGAESGVNYHTYALGREGYITLDLVTGTSTIERFKDRAKTVLAALEYQPGKKYEEFVAGTDRIAEYGIAALVAGVAAKKLGLLALGGLAIAKFGSAVVAFAKPIGLGVVALFAGIGRMFTRRNR
jgi:uncharacterized membrane-anchored protein